LTIDDFERLPAEVAENHELVDGELIDVSGILRVTIYCVIIAEQEFDFLGNAYGPRMCQAPGAPIASSR